MGIGKHAGMKSTRIPEGMNFDEWEKQSEVETDVFINDIFGLFYAIAIGIGVGFLLFLIY